MRPDVASVRAEANQNCCYVTPVTLNGVLLARVGNVATE